VALGPVQIFSCFIFGKRGDGEFAPPVKILHAALENGVSYN